MSENQPQTQSAAQIGSSGEATGVGSAVGGVRSNDEHTWLDLWAMNPETRAYLRAARRDAACSHASSRREGAGDGPQGITTPAKLRHLQDTLYRKAKAQPEYRFWSLYGEESLSGRAAARPIRSVAAADPGGKETVAGTNRMPRHEATRKAGYGKSVRPV